MYSDFEWQSAPLSDWTVPVGSVLAYLAMVFLLLRHMETREKGYAVPKWVVAGHNMILSVGSLIMLVGCLFEVIRHVSAMGGVAAVELKMSSPLESPDARGPLDRIPFASSSFWFFCDNVQAPATGPLFFWSYVYYLSKFYELLDTVFVILKKSNVPHFKLQVYHHALVIPMSWLWVETRQSLQFGGLMFNTFVHVIMYYYYALQVMGQRVWWKKYITMVQITQFSTSFFLLLGTLYMVYYKGVDGCGGFSKETYYSAWYNVAFNATLLYAFVGVSSRNKKMEKPVKKDE